MTQQLLNQLMDYMGDNQVETMSNQIGASKQQTESALAAAIPLLFNAVNKQGAASGNMSGFVQMLDMDKDGSILDDVGSFFNSGRQANGADILSTLLGGRQGQVEKYISNDSGLDVSKISRLLTMAAPVIMSFLGRQNKQTGGGLADLLGSFTGDLQQQAPQNMNVLNQLLDQDNDGDVADDVAELGMSFLSNFLKK